LTLQAGRYLIGCYRDAKKGKKQHGGVAYLNNLAGLLHEKCTATSADQILDISVIGKAYSVVAANVVRKAGEDFEASLAKGITEEEAYEACCKFLLNIAQARLFAAKVHSYGYLFHRFSDGISKAPAALFSTLKNLCLLYGLFNIAELSGPFLQYGFFNAEQVNFMVNLDGLDSKPGYILM
jgi:acyl-CoA oxidase